MNDAAFLPIRLRDGVTLAVPPSLDSITTYVLLEQENWFEKELDFLQAWLKPGMTTIDIGANLGVYALPMARLVGAQGCVFAYEPGSEARRLLENNRDINGAANLQILPLALSDNEREGRLALGHSSELNTLGDDGQGEAVHITSLDREAARHNWGALDFIKIDAEGEEERILAGGRDLFSRHSPLVMFEIKAGDKINQNVCAAFPAMGYQLYRLLVGAPILVPFDWRVPLDSFELNLFAAKPDRVCSLHSDGFLVETPPAWEPDHEAISSGLSFLQRQAFASSFGRLSDKQIDPDYAHSLAAFAVWRNDTLAATTRCAALFFAYRTLAALCNRAPTTAHYSTFARLSWEGGWRGESVTALRQMAAYIRQAPFQPTEPCWLPNPRFDNIVMGGDPALWFATAVLEQLERAQVYSSCFGNPSPWLDWLCRQPITSLEIHRRRTLIATRAGMNPVVPDCLRVAAPDHLNAELWRAGKVPGTRVDL